MHENVYKHPFKTVLEDGNLPKKYICFVLRFTFGLKLILSERTSVIFLLLFVKCF